MIRHEVITPENVPFSYRVAGMGSRFLAWLADAGMIAVLAAVGIILGFVVATGRAGIGLGFVLVWLFILVWGYFLFFEWLWQGHGIPLYLLP